MYDLSDDILREFAFFMTGKIIGKGMSRNVYDHPHDPTKVIKVENSREHFQNVIEWEIWGKFKNEKEVSKWLAPCHAISSSGTFLIMEKALDLPFNKKIEKLPDFLTDHKRENFGTIKNKIVARDYGRIIINLKNKMKNWNGD